MDEHIIQSSLERDPLHKYQKLSLREWLLSCYFENPLHEAIYPVLCDRSTSNSSFESTAQRGPCITRPINQVDSENSNGLQICLAKTGGILATILDAYKPFWSKEGYLFTLNKDNQIRVWDCTIIGELYQLTLEQVLFIVLLDREKKQNNRLSLANNSYLASCYEHLPNHIKTTIKPFILSEEGKREADVQRSTLPGKKRRTT